MEHTMFESSTMLLGYHVGEAHGLNDISTLLTVLVKHYIHVNKCLEKRPTRQGILIYVKDVSKTEGHIYRNNGKNLYYQEKWESVNLWLTQKFNLL